MPAGKLLCSACHCCVSGSLLCYADFLSSELLPSLYVAHLQSSQAWSHSYEHAVLLFLGVWVFLIPWPL